MYLPPNIIKIMKCENAFLMLKMRNPYKGLVRKTERERPLGRPGHRSKDTMKIDFKDVKDVGSELCGLDSSDSGQRSMVGPCELDNE
jgi:hypothetical protein